MTEERDDIVVLVDENGDETEFELIDTFELNEKEYVVLLPFNEDEIEDDEDEEEIIILKVEQNEEGEDSFVSIDDEDELDSVFEEFKLRMDDEYDFDEE